jgi:transcriptional regulator with GAF, ATPase, and Fis domain
LIKQNDTDEAELKQIVNVLRVKEEAEWVAVEQEKKERVEKASKMAQEQSDIEATEWAFAAKKAALHDIKKTAQIVVIDNDNNNDNDDDDQASQSGAEDQICSFIMFTLHLTLIITQICIRE